MPIFLGALVVFLIVIWVWRTQRAVTRINVVAQDGRPLRRGGRFGVSEVFGSKLARIRDARLSAAILMIQLVRTGAPVMASERSTILSLLADPLGVENPQAMYERAWAYTEPRGDFSGTADELLAFLRRQLSPDERMQLIDLLTRVANAYGEAGDLQIERIGRLERRLMTAPAGNGRNAADTLED